MLHPQPPASPQAKVLYKELKKRGINCILEFWDDYKHIDITIPESKIHIELNGSRHYIDPRQIMADLKRAKYSAKDNDFGTISIPNFFIDKHLEEVAEAIAQVAKSKL